MMKRFGMAGGKGKKGKRRAMAGMPPGGFPDLAELTGGPRGLAGGGPGAPEPR